MSSNQSLITFIPGTKAKASEVNDNFEYLQGLITGLGTDYSNFITKNGSVPFSQPQSYATSTISAITNATPMVVTSNSHGKSTGDKILIDGAVNSDGTKSAANGEWIVTKIDSNNISLQNSAGNGTYSAGGKIYPLPTNYENLASIANLEKDSIIVSLGDITNTFTLKDNKIHTANITGASRQMSFPAITDTGKIHNCMLDFTVDSSASGNELIDANNWIATNWTGSYAGGFTHTTGYTTPLTRTLSTTLGQVYKISFSVTGLTAGSLTVGLGNETVNVNANGSYTFYLVSSGSNLTFTPSSDFNGTISAFSVKPFGIILPTNINWDTAKYSIYPNPSLTKINRFIFATTDSGATWSGFYRQIG